MIEYEGVLDMMILILMISIIVMVAFVGILAWMEDKDKKFKFRYLGETRKMEQTKEELLLILKRNGYDLRFASKDLPF